MILRNINRSNAFVQIPFTYWFSGLFYVKYLFLQIYKLFTIFLIFSQGFFSFILLKKGYFKLKKCFF